MDHEYAAAPPSKTPPGLASFLLDHTFAKPPSEGQVYDDNDNCRQKPTRHVDTDDSEVAPQSNSSSAGSVPVGRNLRSTQERKSPTKSPGSGQDGKKDSAPQSASTLRQILQGETHPETRVSSRSCRGQRKRSSSSSHTVSAESNPPEIQPSKQGSLDVRLEKDDSAVRPAGQEHGHPVELPTVVHEVETSSISEQSLLSVPVTQTSDGSIQQQEAGIAQESSVSAESKDRNTMGVKSESTDASENSSKDIRIPSSTCITVSDTTEHQGSLEKGVKTTSEQKSHDDSSSQLHQALLGSSRKTAGSSPVEKTDRTANDEHAVTSKTCSGKDQDKSNADQPQDASSPGLNLQSHSTGVKQTADGKDKTDVAHIMPSKIQVDEKAEEVDGIVADTDTDKDDIVPVVSLQKRNLISAGGESDPCEVSVREDPDGVGRKQETRDSLTKDVRVTARKRNMEEAGLDIHDSKSSPAASKVSKTADHKGFQKKFTPKRGPTDIYDEELVLIPLKEHGWRREVVIRGVFDETKRTPCDVYYFTPDGKKLRSKVMIAQYLAEHPDCGLTVDNFTYARKAIAKWPLEEVRNAGSTSKRPSKGGPKDGSPLPNLSTAPKPTKHIKVKIGHPLKAKATTAVPSTSTSSSQGHSSHTSYSPGSDSEGVEEWDDGDDDYDPLSESTPKWGRNRALSRRSQGHDKSPDREILIMSMPPPEVIIDRADDSHAIHQESQELDNSGATTNQNTGPHMVVLPDAIKQELNDSETENEQETVSTHNQENTVTEDTHVYPDSSGSCIRPKPKPTARKSTMPRIILKSASKTSREKKSRRQDSPELVLSEGQLCSTSCPGLEGQPPQLQCCICMCLFHYECVNVDPSAHLLSFKCLRCRDVSPFSMLTSPPKAAPTPPTVHIQHPATIPPPPLTTRPNILRKGQQTVHSRPLPVLNLPGQSAPASNVLTSRSNLVIQQGPAPPALTQTAPGLVVPPGSDAIEALRKLMSASTGTMVSQPLQPTVSPAPPRLVAPGAAPPQLTASSNVRMAIWNRAAVNSASIPPPRLTAAPGVMVPNTSSSTDTSPPVHVSGATDITIATTLTTCTTLAQGMNMTPTAAPAHAQLLTLPSAVINQLNLSQPLALKINKTQIVVPPSCVINAAEGLKVLLPPSTFPLPSDPNMKLSVTVSNNPASSSSTSASTTVTSSSSSSSSSKVIDSNPNDKGKTTACVMPPSDGSRKLRRRRGRNTEVVNVSQCMMHRLFGGFDSMLHIFRHLGVLDLLRASQVCKTWLRIARQRCLWHHVRFEGLQVPDWEKAAHFLHDVGTRSLCLKGMGHFDDRNRTWHQLMSSLSLLSDLRRIEFGQVPSSVIHSTAEKLSQLEVFRAEHITDFSNEQMWTSRTKVDIGKFASLSKLQELRLRGVSGLVLPTFTFSGKLSELTNLQHLHTLSLTSLCGLRDSEFHFLSEMKQLEVLELGDCLNWSSETYHHVSQLQKLRRLRLEAGGEIPDHVGLGDAIAQLTNLQRLELILFAIPATLKSALCRLESLRVLVVWPDTGNGMLPALVNSHAIAAVEDLQQLDTLEWGVVIRDDGDRSDPASYNRFISRNSTIPLLKSGDLLDPEKKQDSSEVQTLSVTQFTHRLCANLPQCTKIKVFNTQVVGREPASRNA